MSAQRKNRWALSLLEAPVGVERLVGAEEGAVVGVAKSVVVRPALPHDANLMGKALDSVC